MGLAPTVVLMICERIDLFHVVVSADDLLVVLQMKLFLDRV